MNQYNRQKIAWVVFAAAVVLCVYGIVHDGLLKQETWMPMGRRRFLKYLLYFAAGSGIFLTFRPSWILPFAAVATIGYSAWFVGPVAPLAVLYFLGSAYWLGRRTLPGRDVATSAVVGLALWIFLFWILVHFPVNTPVVYAVIIAIPWALSFREVGAAVRQFRFPQLSRAENAAALVLMFVLSAHLLVSLRPETGSDALAVHLAAPMTIVYEGKWAFDFTRFSFALMPMGADWLYTAEYALGGEQATRLFNFAILALNTWVILRLASKAMTRTKALLTAALFASTPVIQYVTGSLMTDNIWAALILCSVTAILESDYVVAGVVLGAGLSVKLGTIAFVIPAIAWCAAAATREKKLRAAAFGLLLLLLLGLPTYVNAYVTSGNPIYPYMNHIFKAPAFDSTTPFVDTRFQKPLTWRTLYDVTFRSDDYYEGQKGGLGFQYFLLSLPALIAARQRRSVLLLCFALTGALLTYTSQANLRYLYPSAVLASAVLTEMIPWWAISGLIALNLGFLPAASWSHREFATTSKRAAREYGDAGFPQRKLIEYLNQNAPGEPVAFFGGDPVAGLRGRAYTDAWHTYEFLDRIWRQRNADEFAEELARLKIHYVIAPASRMVDAPAAKDFLRDKVGDPILTSHGAALFKIPDSALISSPASPVPGDQVARSGEYDGLNPMVHFDGNWRHSTLDKAANGTLSFSNELNATARLTFQGHAVTYTYTRAFNRGLAQISIDGRNQGIVDEYAPQIVWQQHVRYGELGDGQHTIEIKVTRKKNPKSEDVFIDLDSLVVEP